MGSRDLLLSQFVCLKTSFVRFHRFHLNGRQEYRKIAVIPIHFPFSRPLLENYKLDISIPVSLDGTKVPLDGTKVPLDGTQVPLDGTKVNLDGAKVPLV